MNKKSLKIELKLNKEDILLQAWPLCNLREITNE